LCSCIASESRKFFNRVFYLKQINFITGGPLAAGARGNCPRCPPLNPALPALTSQNVFQPKYRAKYIISKTNKPYLSNGLYKITGYIIGKEKGLK